MHYKYYYINAIYNEEKPSGMHDKEKKYAQLPTIPIAITVKAELIAIVTPNAYCTVVIAAMQACKECKFT